jgi:hypothetical protein
MRSRSIFGIMILTVSLTFLGCGGDSSNGNGNSANSSANAARTNSESTNPLETKPVETGQVTNNAPTLTPLVRAYCDAKIKRDEAALRKVFTTDTIQNFEEQMKDQDIKTLVEFLDDEKVSEKQCEVKNEKITGDSAVARIFIDSYPNGSPELYFEKENGEWKMTNKSPSFEAKKAANANTAK